jgi:hypothetical protein
MSATGKQLGPGKKSPGENTREPATARGLSDTPRLRPVPLTVQGANELVARFHRHHRPAQGGLWAIGAELGEEIVGAAIVGRPVARRLQDGRTAEVVRLVVREGVPGCASFLLARCRRAAAVLGYARLVTYTLPEEGGASLRGAGWRLLGEAGGGSWSRADRARADRHPLQRKLRWEVSLA